MKQTAKYHLTGTSSLKLHSGQLIDPLNPWSRALREVTGKRNKTDADHEEASRLEWFGSLYTDEDKRIVIPGKCLTATLINAAKKRKKGMQAKSGLICEENAVVEYDGPEDLEALWQDGRFFERVPMKVQRNGVMRTQPTFWPWAATVVVSYDDNQLNLKDITLFMQIGGEQIGVCEGRPRHGRFTVEVL
jgi:hypothetical protein